jgi:hypothetical protein
MATSVLERISRLSEERSELYRSAGNGGLGGSALRQRVHEIADELDRLWEQRRRQRAGRLEGIDLLVQRAYERLYGRGFDTVPMPVRSEDEPPPRRAA